MPLQVVTQAIGEHFGDGTEMTRSRAQRLERWGAIVGVSGFAMLALLLASVFVCLVIAKIFGLRFEDFGFDLVGPILAPISMLMLLGGALMLGYRTIRRELSAFWSPQIPAPRETGKLLAESPFESAVSVTEHTTELLVREGARGQGPEARKERSVPDHQP
jgi:hypothetical protein